MKIKVALLIIGVLIFISDATKAQTARRFDILIDELMVDPTPQVGLPNNEWIELKNTSTIAINLSGWRIADPTGQSGAMPSYLLKPDSFVIVCTSSAVAAMSTFGPTISVTSFPSLDNDADIIFLKSPQNITIHSISYTSDWYNNDLKKDGGWTLEMIDTKNPCSGSSNWKASTNASGGTPGKTNAVDGQNPDQVSPRLLSSYAIDSFNIALVFDEPLDSLKSTAINNYSISDGIGLPQSVIAISPMFDKVILKLNSLLSRNKVYTVTATTLSDCAGNTIGSDNKARFGLSNVADSMNIVVNEILFNPKANGSDYVELYNRSNNIIDLKQLYIANRNTAGAISNIKQISTESRLLFPQDFVVITESPSQAQSQYFCPHPENFIKLSSMPSFNDDKGDVIILNAQGNIIDELQYDEKWHFKLIDNDEGISLERIDYNATTQQSGNWHSAATSAGYGTPGYKNSQYRMDAQASGDVTVSPKIISPDNDGMDDFATINYNFPEPGYVANISIFDAAGRVVRYLQQNALCGIKGNFRWDGLGEKFQKLPVGIYIFYTEVFNLKGKTMRFKNVVVLARKH